MAKDTISTTDAPAAIGTYSQAVCAGGILYISGQIPLDPKTMELVSSDAEVQIRQVFSNLSAICAAAGTDLNNALKLTIYLTDLQDFPIVNKVMEERFSSPYPARAAVGVNALPRGVSVEIDAIVAVQS
ncbi:MAG: RidA family protein [Pseudomonadales bacterium]|nr:RidA family protein [Pseudomonadales bacterium]